MESMQGHELWTDAFQGRFGDRVCVGFHGFQCVREGERFTPTTFEIAQMRTDQVQEEYGTNDLGEILRREGF